MEKTLTKRVTGTACTNCKKERKITMILKVRIAARDCLVDAETGRTCYKCLDEYMKKRHGKDLEIEDE